VQDEQYVLFHCTHTRVVSLHVLWSLFHLAGFDNVSAYMSQNDNKLFFFLHALIASYEQASSRTS